MIVTAQTRRASRDWVRTALVGADGVLVFAMLKQMVAADFNDDGYQVRPPGEGRPLTGYNRGQAVWASLALARRVRWFGGFHSEGDAVRVLGEFRAACREHGGDMDIHATGLDVVREGRVVVLPGAWLESFANRIRASTGLRVEVSA